MVTRPIVGSESSLPLEASETPFDDDRPLGSTTKGVGFVSVGEYPLWSLSRNPKTSLSPHPGLGWLRETLDGSHEEAAQRLKESKLTTDAIGARRSRRYNPVTYIQIHWWSHIGVKDHPPERPGHTLYPHSCRRKRVSQEEQVRGQLCTSAQSPSSGRSTSDQEPRFHSQGGLGGKIFP